MTLKKIMKALASLQLAVVIILMMAIFIAIGTFVEARFDAVAANKLVYKTIWMYIIFGLLIVNLTAVMVDRWPWQKRHSSFVLAHIGIITLLFGSYVTFMWGLDGSMRVGIGEANRFVQSPETNIAVYASFGGKDDYTKLYEKEVDYFLKPPQKDSTKIQVDDGEIEVIDYEPYMNPSKQVVPAVSNRFGAAVRFQMVNDRVNMNDWLVQRKPQETVGKALGLAQFFLTTQFPPIPEKRNAFYIRVNDQKSIEYLISYRDEKLKPKKGILKEGDTVQTGWMGLEFKLLRFFPYAQEKWNFTKVDRPTPMTTAAIKIRFKGEEYWVQQDDVLKLFTDNAAYILSYGSKRIDIGFQIFLKKFEVGRYPGSTMARSYESLVQVEGEQEEFKISMNEPLKYNGLTIYQASFQENESGPVASIFSVNYDPGRWIKYWGSFLITLGTILLFYNRRKAARAMAPKDQSEVLK